MLQNPCTRKIDMRNDFLVLVKIITDWGLRYFKKHKKWSNNDSANSKYIAIINNDCNEQQDIVLKNGWRNIKFKIFKNSSDSVWNVEYFLIYPVCFRNLWLCNLPIYPETMYGGNLKIWDISFDLLYLLTLYFWHNVVYSITSMPFVHLYFVRFAGSIKLKHWNSKEIIKWH